VEEVVEEAAVVAGGEGVTTSPEVALEVAIRSPEIQDAEPIRSAPMTEATASTRGGIELLEDGLVERTVVWTFLGPLPRWVPGPTTRWAPGTTRLALHGT
jgi:hypothetical protein